MSKKQKAKKAVEKQVSDTPKPHSEPGPATAQEPPPRSPQVVESHHVQEDPAWASEPAQVREEEDHHTSGYQVPDSEEFRNVWGGDEPSR